MLLEARDLTVAFARGRRRRVVFQGVNLAVARGELVGLGGPSGVGKTTLGEALLGMLPPREGRVLWRGRDVYQGGRPAMDPTMRPRFQKLFQDPTASFYPGRSVGDSLAEVVRHHDLARGGPAIRRLLIAALEPLGLEPELLARRPEALSGGEMQRLALARVGLVGPWFLVADEPTSRLDLSVQAQVARLLVHWARQHGVGVLFISHDRELLTHVCDRIHYLGTSDPGEPARLYGPGATQEGTSSSSWKESISRKDTA